MTDDADGVAKHLCGLLFLDSLGSFVSPFPLKAGGSMASHLAPAQRSGCVWGNRRHCGYAVAVNTPPALGERSERLPVDLHCAVGTATQRAVPAVLASDEHQLPHHRVVC